MDVLHTAWQPNDRPLTATTPTLSGSCARCGAAQAALVSTRDVVSKTFTGYERWRQPAGAGLCPACVWGYRTPALRATAHLVSRTPVSLQQLEPGRLGPPA